MSKSAVLQDVGISAACAGNSSAAMSDFRRAESLNRVQPENWMKLGLALDQHGDQEDAFAAYRNGLGFLGRWVGQDPQMQEAFARFGILCERRGRHQDAVRCYNAGRQWEAEGNLDILDKTLDARTVSSKSVRMLLDLVLGDALENEKRFDLYETDHSTEARTAFQAAVRLAPNDSRPEYILAEYLRRAKCFPEAKIGLKRVSHLDVDGKLRAETSKSSDLVKARDSD